MNSARVFACLFCVFSCCSWFFARIFSSSSYFLFISCCFVCMFVIIIVVVSIISALSSTALIIAFIIFLFVWYSIFLIFLFLFFVFVRDFSVSGFRVRVVGGEGVVHRSKVDEWLSSGFDFVFVRGDKLSKLYSRGGGFSQPGFVNYLVLPLSGELLRERCFSGWRVRFIKRGDVVFYCLVPDFSVLSESLFFEGWGLFELLFSDGLVEDVLFDAPNSSLVSVVDSEFGECFTNFFPLEEEVLRLCSLLRLSTGEPFDPSHPSVSSSIPGFSIRVTAVMEPVTFSGVSFSFRRHKSEPLSLFDLVGSGFLSPLVAGFLSVLAWCGVSILISGPRGSGKTTLLGALLLELPRSHRLIVLEDAAELPVSCLIDLGFKVNHLRFTSSTASSVLRTVLRLGESVLVIGEVRGGEVKQLFEAMRVGMGGKVVLGTIHGSSARDTFDRVVSDLGVSPNSFRSVDLVVSLFTRVGEDFSRERFVSEVCEVVSEGEGVGFRSLFKFDGEGQWVGGFVDSLVFRRAAQNLGVSVGELERFVRSRVEFFRLVKERGVRVPVSKFSVIKKRYFTVFNPVELLDEVVG